MSWGRKNKKGGSVTDAVSKRDLNPFRHRNQNHDFRHGFSWPQKWAVYFIPNRGESADRQTDRTGVKPIGRLFQICVYSFQIHTSWVLWG
jgi:hypothetical protein